MVVKTREEGNKTRLISIALDGKDSDGTSMSAHLLEARCRKNEPPVGMKESFLGS